MEEFIFIYFALDKPNVWNKSYKILKSFNFFEYNVHDKDKPYIEIRGSRQCIDVCIYMQNRISWF